MQAVGESVSTTRYAALSEKTTLIESITAPMIRQQLCITSDSPESSSTRASNLLSIRLSESRDFHFTRRGALS